MSANRRILFDRLEALGIAQITIEHAPMFTVEQSREFRGQIPGAHTKNLFLIEKEGRMVLVVAKEDTRVDLKALASRLGHGRYSFGKASLLLTVLGVEAGSVTPFALINDGARDVTVVIDKSLMDFAEVNCHPLDNTATTRLKTADFMRFIRACGHEPMILPLA
ncbi:MAG: prolyl-tRNA synthetase associated domain-containing protein [Methyloceanibacter sp.]|uniref:prolyl-tRNA synthetase associated domain-containing protein n=1 Tax=Methyloceanibacter sp. TaxID=1965321 RepID=UPI003D9BE5A8